jgi:hypothetical protein
VGGTGSRTVGTARASWASAGILVEHGPVQRLQLGPGLDAEAVDERCPGARVRLERLGLPAGAVERDHELPAEPLAQRVVSDQPFELGDELAVAPVREVGVDPVLDQREPELVEARDLGLRPRLVPELVQDGPAEDGERRPHALRRPIPRREPAQLRHVERVPVAKPQGVATGARVSIASRPSARRSRATYPWSAFAAVADGSPSHSASTSASADTTFPASSSRSASTACGFPAGTAISRPPSRTSSGPRIP